MKNTLIVLTAAALFAALPASAKDVAPDQVPQAARTFVESRYADARGLDWDWDADDSRWEAEFATPAGDVEVQFDAEGRFVRSKEDVARDAMPAAILNAVEARHPHARVLGANKLTTPEGVFWDVGLRRPNGGYRNILVDDQGRIVRE